MPVYDLYSKRKKASSGEQPDVYAYDEIPLYLRIQIIHIWDDAFGTAGGERMNVYQWAVETLCREYGKHYLFDRRFHEEEFDYELKNFFQAETNIDRVLDVIELTFYAVNSITRRFDYIGRQHADRIATDAISELNIRFRESGIGYQFENAKIIRIDSEFIHQNAVKPALSLLSNPAYAGAQDEFLTAHEHFRHGNTKESIVECLKSFESMMKAICTRRSWTFNGNGTAKDLIKSCLDHGLIPPFWQEKLTSLRVLLESSIPTGRNKLAGHGQGTTPTEVPTHIAAYMLHMTASTLVFLGESDKALDSAS